MPLIISAMHKEAGMSFSLIFGILAILYAILGGVKMSGHFENL